MEIQGLEKELAAASASVKPDERLLRIKALMQNVAGYVPGGSLVTNLMDDEHAFRKNPNPSVIEARKVRKNGKEFVENWEKSGYFMNKDGLAIFWRSWLPKDAVEPKGLIMISHGLAEHSLRYSELGNILAENGYAVYALDHQGMGLSEGTRLHVKSFSDFITDVHHFTELSKAKHPKVEKVYLLGHSMGSLIAIHSVQAAPDMYDGVILGSPPLEVELPPFADKVGPILSTFFPKLPAPSLDISTLCRDEAVVDRYMNDPLVPHDYSPKLRLMSELVGAIGLVKPEAFPIPYLLMHGTDDQICKIQGSIEFHKKTTLPEEKRMFVPFEGSYHELFNEPDRQENAIAHALQWLNEK